MRVILPATNLDGNVEILFDILMSSFHLNVFFSIYCFIYYF